MKVINEQIKRSLAWINETPEKGVLSETKVYGGGYVSEMELIALKETYSIDKGKLTISNGMRTVIIIIEFKN